MHYQYQTEGTCSAMIEFDLDNNIIHNVNFLGGCNGNLQGISKLVEGLPAEQVISRLEGIRCGWKDTSCPDQLTRALKQALARQ
ncbi:MAG: TIGR03905 family TSCPD domain-containing protein [Bacteroidales bacterium]|nr:TIGR03905 family TSCPD domain-containing protein [Bacteroidales bacterium]